MKDSGFVEISEEEFEKRKDEFIFRIQHGCNHCLGRGYEGKNTLTGNLVICKCVIKSFLKERPTLKIQRSEVSNK